MLIRNMKIDKESIKEDCGGELVFWKNVLARSHSIIFAWLLSYVSVMLIPVFFSAIIYVKSIDALEKETYRANESLLMQVQQTVDARMVDLDQLLYEIALNNRVGSLINIHPTFSNYDQYNILSVVKELKTYSASNSFIADVYVYYKNSDIVLSSKYRSKVEDVFKIVKPNDVTTVEQWKGFFGGKYLRDFVQGTRITEKGEPAKVVLYAVSLPMESTISPEAVIIFVIDGDKLLENIKNTPIINDSVVSIIDKDNHMIATTNQGLQQNNVMYDELLGKSGVITQSINNHKAAISYVASDIIGWKYVSTTDSKIFWKKSEYIRLLTLIGVLLCTLFGGIVTFFYVRKNYHPVDKLIKAISTKGNSFAWGHNEYGFIQTALSNTLDEKERILFELRKQDNVMRAIFLANLLKGKIERKISISESLSTFHITFEADSFVVAIFYIEDLTGFDQKEKDSDAVEKIKLAQFIITNVFEEMVNKHSNGYMTEVDEMLACIINFKNTEMDDYENKILYTIKQAQNYIEENFKILFSVSVSGIHKSLSSIPEAYEEANEAMEYTLIVGNRKIIDFNEVKSESYIETKGGYYFPLLLEQQLVNCIKIGDLKASKDIVEEVFQKNMTSFSVSLDMARCLIFDLASTMLKTMNEIKSIYGESMFEKMNLLESIVNCKTVQKMKEEIISTLERVCQLIEEKNKSEDYKLRDDAITYIHPHYNYSNLSVSMIADHFGMTRSYFSKLFKEQSGETLADYINKTRIKKAKELLKEHNFTVNEVANKVGISDINTFTRVFKKYEGITPGKFK